MILAYCIVSNVIDTCLGLKQKWPMQIQFTCRYAHCFLFIVWLSTCRCDYWQWMWLWLQMDRYSNCALFLFFKILSNYLQSFLMWYWKEFPSFNMTLSPLLHSLKNTMVLHGDDCWPIPLGTFPSPFASISGRWPHWRSSLHSLYYNNKLILPTPLIMAHRQTRMIVLQESALHIMLEVCSFFH